jgi:hypothetical protein
VVGEGLLDQVGLLVCVLDVFPLVCAFLRGQEVGLDFKVSRMVLGF